jgi:coenzyme F420-reducing hydrogenase beta subunit
MVRDEKELVLLQGSKYVQSDISGIYDEIRQELRSGKKVLFFGTPCQVDAMNSFFGRNENYYSVDIICHGVPPVDYLNSHLKNITGGRKYDRFRFRGSPDDFTLKVYNGEELLYSKSDLEDTYFYAFLNSLTYRENCYNCRYAKAERTGDLTIGDFWGIDTKSLKKAYDGNISVVLVNTEKGRELFERIRPQLVCERRETEEAVRGNPQLRRPSLRHGDRVKFLHAYMETRDFGQAIAVTGIEKAMKRMQFGRTAPGKVYVFVKKIWQGR